MNTPETTKTAAPTKPRPAAARDLSRLNAELAAARARVEELQALPAELDAREREARELLDDDAVIATARERSEVGIRLAFARERVERVKSERAALLLPDAHRRVAWAAAAKEEVAAEVLEVTARDNQADALLRGAMRTRDDLEIDVRRPDKIAGNALIERLRAEARAEDDEREASA